MEHRLRFRLLSGTFLSLLCALSTAATAAPVAPKPVVFDGHPASPVALLAKLKNPDDAKAATAAKRELSDRGLTSSNFGLQSVNGLVKIELAAQANQKAAAPLTADALAAHMKALLATGMYEYVEPDWIISINQSATPPTDSGFTNGTLWGLKNVGQSGGTNGVDVNAVAAWGVATGSPSVVVGVVDTCIRYTHQDLAANIWRNPGETANNGIDDDRNGYVDDVFGMNAVSENGNPMDDRNHGTHCAGTIAAVDNNAGGHVGVAYGARLMALKFLDSGGSGTTSAAIQCINYGVAKGAKILKQLGRGRLQ